jgi:DnaJ-domain-containing protein 1
LLYGLEKKLAGSVELRAAGQRTAAILFVGGRPAKVRTSEPISYLGRCLVELGLLGEDALLPSLARFEASREPGGLFGRHLVETGLVGDEDVAEGLRLQVLDRLLHVAAFPSETTYEYYAGYDGVGAPGSEPGQGYDPVPMIWTLLRAQPPTAHVEAALGRVADASFRVGRTAQPNRLGLERDYASAVDLLRVRPMRVDELVAASGLDATESRLLAYLLLVTKQVDVLRAPAGSTPPRSGGFVSSPPPPRASPVPRDGPSFTPHPPPSIRSSISRITRSSAPPERPSSGPVMTTKALISSDPPRRPPPSMPPTLAPELRERWTEIAQRSATIDRADYFSMLEIARDATRDEVEAAFLTLAKHWHPDRLAAELAPLRDACARVFSRISEARATLADPDQRARYMKLLADGSGSPEMQETVARVIEAATNFQKAEVCFRRNDLVQAEAFCRKALEADATQPDYGAMLAWLTALKPENQSIEKTRACIHTLERCISMSDKCEKAYYWRAMLYKRIGRPDAAFRDFKRVVELNPRNIDAAREVRLYRMRGGARSSNPPAIQRTAASEAPKPDDSKPGLFGRLFKKP